MAARLAIRHNQATRFRSARSSMVGLFIPSDFRNPQSLLSKITEICVGFYRSTPPRRRSSGDRLKAVFRNQS